MAFRGRKQTHFGSKGPNKLGHVVEFKMLLANIRTLDALPSPTSLAYRYRMDAKDVEYQIGVERRRRAEVGIA